MALPAINTGRLLIVGLTFSGALLTQCDRTTMDFRYSVPPTWRRVHSGVNSIEFRGPQKQVLSFFSEALPQGVPPVQRWNFQASFRRQHGFIITDSRATICGKIAARYVRAHLRGSEKEDIENLSAIWNHRLYTAAYFYPTYVRPSSAATHALYSICPDGIRT